MVATRVTDVEFSRASDADRDLGLLGWVRLRAGDLLLDGVAVRRTRGGRLALSWPVRRAPSGAEYAYARPVDDRAREAIEAQVFAQLGSQTEEGGRGR